MTEEYSTDGRPAAHSRPHRHTLHCGGGGATSLRPVESNARVRNSERAAQKAPEWMTDIHTDTGLGVKATTRKAKDKAKDLTFKAKAKDLIPEHKLGYQNKY